MAKLVSDAQLASLRSLAENGMQSSVQIMKYSTGSSTYGDNDLPTFTYSTTVDGWLRSQPEDTVMVQFGQEQVNATHRLFVPVDTDVAPYDRVVIGGKRFQVVDTNVESTYKVLLRVTLRKSE